MRLHFPSAEPRTASETGRWFLCCPLWWQRCISRFLAPVLWLAGYMVLLSWWQPGERCVSFQVPDTLQSCCLLPVWLPLPARLQCNWDGTLRKYQEQWVSEAIDFPLAQGIRVAPSGRLPSLLKRLAGSFTSGIWAILMALHNSHSSGCDAAVCERFCGRPSHANLECRLSYHRHKRVTHMSNNPVWLLQLFSLLHLTVWGLLRQWELAGCMKPITRVGRWSC